MDNCGGLLTDTWTDFILPDWQEVTEDLGLLICD